MYEIIPLLAAELLIAMVKFAELSPMNGKHSYTAILSPQKLMQGTISSLFPKRDTVYVPHQTQANTPVTRLCKQNLYQSIQLLQIDEPGLPSPYTAPFAYTR